MAESRTKLQYKDEQHEQILTYAKALLRNEKIDNAESLDKRWLLEALLFVEGKKRV